MSARNFAPGPLTRAAMRAPDFSADFWPTGWMVWACAVVGSFDIGIVAYLAYAVIAR
jgi:hypothetical protein